MDFEPFHGSAGGMEQQDNAGLFPCFEFVAQEQGLGAYGEQEQGVIAVQGPVGLPDQLGGDDGGQKECAEQAGPALFQHEHGDFGEPMGQQQTRAVAERAFYAACAFGGLLFRPIGRHRDVRDQDRSGTGRTGPALWRGRLPLLRHCHPRRSRPAHRPLR